MHQGESHSDYDVPNSHAVCMLHERLAIVGCRQNSSSCKAAAPADPDTVPRLLSGRLLERLDTVKLQPKVVLDLGCNSAARLHALRERYPQATLVGVGWSNQQIARLELPGFLRHSGSGVHNWFNPIVERINKGLRPWRPATLLLSSAPEQLPLGDASIDLVVADQLLPWCETPQLVFAEVLRVLKPGGAFFWSSAGPDTLREYRLQWQSIDTYAHVWGLRDMHDLGDDMLRSGFSAPVMDRENITIHYQSVSDLVTELRANKLINIAVGRRRGLMSPEVHDRLQRAAADKYLATFELIQGHGWKPEVAPQQTSTGSGAEVYVPADSIERLVR